VTTAPIRLPLWALRDADACELGERVADFTAYHGYPPSEDSTWTEWWEVTPDLGARLGDVTCALPLVYPDRRRDLLRAVVQFAYQVARRTQPYFAADPAPRKALALTRRWLAGKDVAGAKLWDVSVDAAAEAARGNINARIAASAATYATYAAYAADAAIAADADAFDVGYHAHAYQVAPTALYGYAERCIPRFWGCGVSRRREWPVTRLRQVYQSVFVRFLRKVSKMWLGRWSDLRSALYLLLQVLVLL